MTYTQLNKRKLLQGASALILGTMSVAAMAADVTTTTSTIDPSSVDALKVSSQENDNAATADANSNEFSIYSDYETYDSSVAQDGDGASATAQGNNKIDSLTDTAAAEIDTTNAISVDQYNSGSVAANVNETETWVYSWGADGSTFDVTNNDNLSVSQGNNAATTTSLTGYATNSTESTMAALQNNDGGTGGISVTANANNNNTNLGLDEFVDGSRGSLSANTDRSAATGNSLTQQMTLGGTTLALGTVSASVTTFALEGDTGDTGDTGGTIAVQADGAAILSSSQINTNADTSASTYGSRMNIFSQNVDINGSALDLSSNIQDATATGSAAGNTMTLSGTTVGTGAAIVSSQTNDADSGVTAYTKAEAGIVTGNLGNNDASSVSLTDNKIQSRATGGSVSNTMTASATTVTLQQQDQSPSVDIGNGVWPADTTLSGTVSGAFVTLNDQLIEGDVSATTTAQGSNGPAFRVYADKYDGSANVIGSTINNDRNTLSAQAQAAVASNSTTLTVGGSLTEVGNTGDTAGTVANGAAIGNIQQIADTANVSATVDTDTDVENTVSAVLTEVTGNLDGATLVASSNKVQAFAEGATSTNTLTVSARTLDVADGSTANAGSQATGAGYSPTNTAFAVVNVQDSGTGSVEAVLTDSVMIETVIGGTVDGSKVTSAGNMQDAFASSNKSTNALSLSATTLSGDAGVVNNQISGSDVTAWIGGSNGEGFDAGATGANAGAIVAVGNDITGSTIAVTGNMVRGSAISNSGTNSLTVAATTLNGDGAVGQAFADTGSTTTTADYGLGSYQETQAAGSSETQVVATYGIDQAFDKLLSGSSLSVSNNVQFAEALANTVSNRVTLSATGMGEDRDAVAALNNNQYVDSATINSTSDMTVFANAASDGSSIALNGNSNTALGVANNATNVMSVTAVTMDGLSDPATVNGLSEYVSADYALLNNQVSDEGGVVNSTAVTKIYNQDITDIYDNEGEFPVTSTAGLLNSSVTLSNNVTTAEASSNRALNSLSVSATDIYATGAVGNLQTSNVEVTAIASNTSVKMDLASRGDSGDSDYVASGSTVTMANNSTTALARGNSASNTLNYTAGATYSANGSDAFDDGASVQATAAVMNGQFNDGTVTATANDVRYSIALNDGGEGLAYGPLNSSVSMTGNTVTAVAFGNTANNNLTMSTFGAGIPSSINSNVQFNGGVVQASASGGFMGIFNVSDVQGSAIRNSGNAVSATAIGNNSVSTISGGN